METTKLKDLLYANAQVDLTNSTGRTPLRLASLKDFKEVAALLIKKVTDTNIRDEQGMTALSLRSGKRSRRVDLASDRQQSRGWEAG